jgi:hypothetical protein
MSVTVAVTLKELPTKCGECKFYSEGTYTCHNERGKEPHCALGYMNGDMRDQSYKDSLYFDCRLKDNII